MSGAPMIRPRMNAPAPTVPRSIPFRIIKEDWSLYTILDGEVFVSVRAVLLAVSWHVRRAGEPPVPDGALDIQAAFLQAVRANEKWLGTPNPNPVDPERVKDKARVVPFQRIEEPENRYAIASRSGQEFTFTTRLNATAIKLIRDTYDALGNPYLNVDSQTVSSLAYPVQPGDV